MLTNDTDRSVSLLLESQSQRRKCVSLKRWSPLVDASLPCSVARVCADTVITSLMSPGTGIKYETARGFSLELCC